MRTCTPQAKGGLLAASALLSMSLAGCSSSMFSGSTAWEGGTLYNEQNATVQDEGPMRLELESDGTGYAIGIPQGRQKEAGNVCIDVAGDERYDGEVSWRKVSDFSFEIEFADSTYTLTDGPGKFVADWTEVRIYTCNWGYEYWSMHIDCAEPNLVAREIPSCR